MKNLFKILPLVLLGFLACSKDDSSSPSDNPSNTNGNQNGNQTNTNGDDKIDISLKYPDYANQTSKTQAKVGTQDGDMVTIEYDQASVVVKLKNQEATLISYTAKSSSKKASTNIQLPNCIADSKGNWVKITNLGDGDNAMFSQNFEANQVEIPSLVTSINNNAFKDAAIKDRINFEAEPAAINDATIENANYEIYVNYKYADEFVSKYDFAKNRIITELQSIELVYSYETTSKVEPIANNKIELDNAGTTKYLKVKKVPACNRDQVYFDGNNFVATQFDEIEVNQYAAMFNLLDRPDLEIPYNNDNNAELIINRYYNEESDEDIIQIFGTALAEDSDNNDIKFTIICAKKYTTYTATIKEAEFTE